MRGRSVMAVILAATLAACGSSYELDRPLTSQSDDWLQFGGNAGRTNIAHATSNVENTSSTGLSTNGFDIVWEYGLEGPAGKAAPLLVQGTVLFFSNTGWGEAVDLASGEQIGEFPCKWFIHATPAVTDDCLFVATNGIEPLLLCFDLMERIIRYETAIPSVHASLCAVGDRVILAARNGEVSSYGARDTLPNWRVPLRDLIMAAPAATDSVVIVAGQNGDLNALAISDGRKLWRISTGSAFIAGPSLSKQSAASVNVAGVVTMVDITTGKILWQVDLGEPVYQGIAWKDNALALALSGGDLVILDAADGHEFGRIATGELPGAAPIHFGNHILLLQRRGVLVDIDPASGSVTEIARLDSRSETTPLITPRGIVLVDEEGEGMLVRME